MDFQSSRGNLLFMKYLGIDYGTKKVGIAISDDGGEFAFPNSIWPLNDALKIVEDLCKREKIEVIVIGESRASNDIPNDIVTDVNSFKAKLGINTRLPIFLEREAYSSVEAHRYQEKKGDRDDSAAAIILQRFLDKKKK